MEVEETVDDPMDIDDTVPETQIIEKSKEQQNGNENALDVVILDDDDDSDGATLKNTTNGSIDVVIDLVPDSRGADCINYSCKSGKELIVAPSFCLSYYRVKSSNKIEKKVCSECYKIAVKMYDSLVNEMKSGKLLFDIDVPILNDMVEIEDSDEEDIPLKKEEDYIDDENLKFIEKNIDDVLHKVMAKFNLKERIKKEETSLKERFAKTQGNFN